MISTKLKQSYDMRTAAYIVVPTIIHQQGKSVKTFSSPKERFGIFCNFKSYGGSEVVNNGVIMVMDTAEVVCWYDPRIKAACRLQLADSGAYYDIIGEPEDIDKAHMFCKFKVQRVKGGA